MGNGMTLKMELPKVPDIELVALEGLDRLGRYLGIADEKLGEARILVTEAVINALEHSAGPNPVVTVEYTMTSKELVIYVRDYGKGFEPSSVEDPEIESKLKSANKRGWGLKVMRSMSDDFRIESSPTGTRIVITKRLA